MNENQTEEIQVLEINPDTVYQQDKALIDMQISTAKASPRSIRQSTDDAVAIVTMRKETAHTCTYALPRGGKNITGPSVHLAKILAQCWGNLRAETKVVDIGAKHITSQAICFDLQKNVAIKVEVKRSIMTKIGRMNDDMITVTGNAANAIALRNAVFAVIPRDVIDTVYGAAIMKITGDVSDENKLLAKRKQVVDALKEAYKVSEEQILGAVGKSSMAHIGSEEIVLLIGIGQAIKDGDTSIEEAFKPSKKARKTTSEHEEERLAKLITEAETEAILLAYEPSIAPGSDNEKLFKARLKELAKK